MLNLSHATNIAVICQIISILIGFIYFLYGFLRANRIWFNHNISNTPKVNFIRVQKTIAVRIK